MVPDRYAALVADLLAKADITIGGARPWDITVHDERFYKRAITGASMGLGESFMDGWWDCPALDQAIAHMMSANLQDAVKIRPWMAADIISETLPNLPYVWPGLRPFLIATYGRRFYLIGIGKDQQVAPDNTAEGRKKNRRVEVQ